MIKTRTKFSLVLAAGFIFLFACGGGGGINKTQDTDGDGMPDWWELTYGLDPNNPTDASLDSDQDGWTNFEEYQNGTDPRVTDPPKELCNGLDDDGNGLIDEIWLENGTPCGMCGVYQCSADGLSLDCQGQGACTPGDNQNCGSNGMKTCLDGCLWGDCFEALQCMTGEQQTLKCGYCEEGLQARTCGYDGKWRDWTDCQGRGCQPKAREGCQIDGKSGTHLCSDQCAWGDCAAECNPGERMTESCGDCGGTRDRVCLSEKAWGGWNACQCEDQTGSQDFPGYDTQTRTCSMATLCKWSPWTNCTLAGAECKSGAFETQICGCGGNGMKIRTCSEICIWGDWGGCENDIDGAPPSPPEILAPAAGSAFYALPITFGWTSSSDNCGLSNSGAYRLSFLSMDNAYAAPITVETDSTSYELTSFRGGIWNWWAQAKDAAGNYSAPSLVRNFTFYAEEITREAFDSPTMTWNWTKGDENLAGGGDYWSQVNYRSHSGTYSSWCAAVGDQSDDECKASPGPANVLAHSYDNYMSAFMETLLYSGGHSRLTLSFWYWLEVVGLKDCLKVRVRSQSGIWTEVWNKCENSTGWVFSLLDLSAYAGQTGITLQFRFESDGSGHCAEGAYLDDIVVEGW